MIAADTSTWIAFLEGSTGRDVQLLDKALEERRVLLATGWSTASKGISLAGQRKARLGDALIAQTCIDRGISLLTRDRNFRAFGEAAALDLVLGIGPG